MNLKKGVSMNRKRKLMLFLSGVALLTITISSFATTATYSAGAIYRAYAFGTYSKSSGTNKITAECTKLAFTSPPSSSPSLMNYHFGRPQSIDGNTLYASRQKVYKGQASSNTPFDLNSTGASATSYMFKVANPYYEELSNSDVKMEVAGTVTSD